MHENVSSTAGHAPPSPPVDPGIQTLNSAIRHFRVGEDSTGGSSRSWKIALACPPQLHLSHIPAPLHVPKQPISSHAIHSFRARTMRAAHKPTKHHINSLTAVTVEHPKRRPKRGAATLAASGTCWYLGAESNHGDCRRNPTRTAARRAMAFGVGGSAVGGWTKIVAWMCGLDCEMGGRCECEEGWEGHWV